MATTDTPLDDCLGPLATLYQLAGGSNWTDNSGWDGWTNPGDCCYASGITCNRDSRVLFINLTANNLVGQLPEDVLSSMTHLFALIVTGNPGLTGLIPEDIPSIPKLYKLDLSHNSLNGEVPDSFYNFTSATLQSIFLNNNRLTGPMPPLGGAGIENNLMADNTSCSFAGNQFSCIDPGNTFVSCQFDRITPICKAPSTPTPWQPRPVISPAATSDSGLKSAVGLGIGASLAFVLLILAIGFFISYRRRNASDDAYRGKTDSARGFMGGSYEDGSSVTGDKGDVSSIVMLESPYLRRWWEQTLLIDTVKVQQQQRIIQGQTYRAAVDFRPATPGTPPHPDDIRIRPNDLLVIESVSPDGTICTGWNLNSKRRGRFPAGCLCPSIAERAAVPESIQSSSSMMDELPPRQITISIRSSPVSQSPGFHRPSVDLIDTVSL
ncbi:hypothetical protein SmJEL517_g05529 [Synchytrium microbalum]|uniref:Leucine-rich repeat-containing N-terminal plant-type domain-containing protein n=1 Tax=Synchytrium microbalum TaxID=1806994 RepID=A0A507BZ56_9FUNG|nr:uncharacterized protein SmJEL517_g05529 [Synchytrium microbalum]TPX31074.1 hypothetical protein SmJEL517_g05529 [Synchytrium microbalum]